MAEAKKQLARLVSDIAEGKYGAKVDPTEKVTLSMLGLRTLTTNPEQPHAGVSPSLSKRWKPKRLPLIPLEWSHGSSASTIFVI
jgi:hypothetical protein